MNCVRSIVGVFSTNDMIGSEKKLLDRFGEVFEKKNNEWFMIPKNSLKDAKKLFVSVFELC